MVQTISANLCNYILVICSIFIVTYEPYESERDHSHLLIN